MTQAPRRNLRNCNTCPIIPNPLLHKEDIVHLGILVPDPIKAALPTPTLTCSQISSIPTLLPPRAPEDALRRMRAASEWQAGSIRALGLFQGERPGERGQIEGPNSTIAHRLQASRADLKQGVKGQAENSIYSVLFENELQDFIMNAPPANYDYDFQYYTNLAFGPTNALFPLQPPQNDHPS